MISNQTIDYLIIGQGLAGSIITTEISSRGYSFQIIDNHHKSSASMAAGGIMHPMSFKRMIESWRSLEFITYASSFYQQLEKKWGDSFFEAFRLKRPFGSIEEQNDWMAKMKQEGYKDWMNLSLSPVEGIDQPYGVGEVFPAGKLDIPKFLEQSKSKFQSQLKQQIFNFDELHIVENGVIYQGQQFNKVIFCEGFQYINNPYFGYLPNNVTKGELLEIKSSILGRNLISKGCFIAPHSEKDTFTVGSTYVWDNTDESLTEEGRNELVLKLKKAGITNYTISQQKCGIRPTTHDRRPLIGFHPIHNQLLIFNGMGSKTVMMAPIMAKQLLDEIEGVGEVYQEANIKRLEKKHFHKNQHPL